MPSSREVIWMLEQDGWRLKRVKGDHHQFVHPTKSGKVTVPHPKKDLTRNVLASIEQQGGLILRRR